VKIHQKDLHQTLPAALLKRKSSLKRRLQSSAATTVSYSRTTIWFTKTTTTPTKTSKESNGNAAYRQYTAIQRCYWRL